MLHILREEDKKLHCIYCGNANNGVEWKSVWNSDHHYKQAKCECGKKLAVRVNYDGSGHDSFDEMVNRMAASLSNKPS